MAGMDRSPLEGVIVLAAAIALCIIFSLVDRKKFNPLHDPTEAQRIRSARLPLRFSVRTLLIAMTVAALLLAVAIYAVK
jgi:hypothetical protein